MLKTRGIEPHWLVSFLSDACEASWTASSDGYVLDIPEWRRFTGQSQEQVEGDGWANAVHPDDRNRALETWRAAVRDVTVYTCAYRVRYVDDNYYTLISIAAPIKKRDGTVFQWFGASFRLPEADIRPKSLQTAHVKDVTPAHLKAARAALGWSIATMAEKSGISPMTLRRIEGQIADARVRSSSVEKAISCLERHGITMLQHNGRILVAIEQPDAPQ